MLIRRRGFNQPWSGFAINHVVGLEVPEGPFAGLYGTRVCDIEAGRLAVATPTRAGAPIWPQPQTPVLVWHGRPGGMYRVAARVDEVADRPLALVWLKDPGKAERTQRRDFVRLPLVLSLTYEVKPRAGSPRRQAASRPAGEKGQVVSLQPTRRRGRTKDLSAGGTMLLLPEKLEPGTVLDLEIAMGSQAPLCTQGEVVRVAGESSSGRDKEVETAVRFVNLSETETDRVVGFLFAEEPKLRRKGLL